MSSGQFEGISGTKIELFELCYMLLSSNTAFTSLSLPSNKSKTIFQPALCLPICVYSDKPKHIESKMDVTKDITFVEPGFKQFLPFFFF